MQYDTPTLAPHVAQRAARQLVPQSMRSFMEEVTEAGWRKVPSTYIICEQDQALPPRFQEAMSAHSGAVHRLASSHSPFLSMPGELARLRTGIALSA